MTFIPTHVHSHFSLLDGLAKPAQIASRCKEIGASACALTDHGSISGAAAFVKACKKEGVKPILGAEFYVTEGAASLKDKDNIVSHQVILAKNLKGWYKLIQLVSASNDKDRFYYKPRIDVDMMKDICDDNLISFSGHLGSTLHLRANNIPSEGANYVNIMQDIFGPENFFIEVQSIDSMNTPDALRLTGQMRELSEQTRCRRIATCDAHYARKEDSIDHQVLLCSSLQTTLKKVRDNPNAPMGCFFDSQQFHIPDEDEILYTGSTAEEVYNTQVIADMCEHYDITGPPKLPKFPCPDGMSETAYLKKLCVKGWYNRNKGWDKDVYGDRVRRELDVIQGADLAGYFLIVQDYVNWGKQQGWLIGPGRGSGAGSLVSYLLGITCVNPIEHGLIFERFYNAGRNTADRVSLPDIDVDFPIKKRSGVIEYLKDKYGSDRVCQMATFGRLMGRGAIKEVLRVHSACDYEEMNTISKLLPQEQEISDQLEAADETSIIRWTLEHDPKLMADYCRMEGDVIVGDYAKYFEQAIRLEGTYKSQGKHAAGIVLSAEPLDLVCPMINDKNSEEKIAGMSMNDLESMGHVKFDVLGVAALDKLMAVNSLLQFGRINL